MDLDPRRLRLLREVALRGTIAAAAAAVGYTPSAVSQQLAALERSVGVPLLERHGRSVRLTAHGTVLVEGAADVLAALETAAGALEAARDEVFGSLLVSFMPSFAPALVLPVAVAMTAEHPALDLVVVDRDVDTALVDLRLGHLDAVVGHAYGHAPRAGDPDHELESVVLLREPLLAATPDSGTGPVRLTDLADRPWACGPKGSSCGGAVLEACAAAGFRPDVRVESTDFGVLLAAVAHGMVTLVPEMAFAASPVPLVGRPVADALLHRDITVTYRRAARRRPAIVELVTRMRDAAAGAAAGAAPPGVAAAG